MQKSHKRLNPDNERTVQQLNTTIAGTKQTFSRIPGNLGYQCPSPDRYHAFVLFHPLQ